MNNIAARKSKILLFSTLSPYPFWAGSENYWFDLVRDPRTSTEFQFHVRLADSPVTRQKAAELTAAGTEVGFYKHYNVEFLRRNIGRVRDRLTGRTCRTLPWYDEIGKGSFDLVWFNVDGLHNLHELEYAVSICKRKGIPYWLMLQHAPEDFFLVDTEELVRYLEIVTNARRFIFIAERNRRSLERALGRRLGNAFHSQNALPSQKLDVGAVTAARSRVPIDSTARFFSLGRYSPRDKGQHLLLEALSAPQWKGRDWRLTFIGMAAVGTFFIETLARYFQLDRSRIEILPFTENVFEEIGKHDVLLMPSLAEGTPFAMIESMACGRPALGTPVGGIPELILSGETGWLARTTDVADVGEALERMWTDRSKWRLIGETARVRVAENNNEQKVFSEILEILREDAGVQ